jgi:hypothetical protein
MRRALGWVIARGGAVTDFVYPYSLMSLAWDRDGRVLTVALTSQTPLLVAPLEQDGADLPWGGSRVLEM